MYHNQKTIKINAQKILEVVRDKMHFLKGYNNLNDWISHHKPQRAEESDTPF